MQQQRFLVASEVLSTLARPIVGFRRCRSGTDSRPCRRLIRTRSNDGWFICNRRPIRRASRSIEFGLNRSSQLRLGNNTVL